MAGSKASKHAGSKYLDSEVHRTSQYPMDTTEGPNIREYHARSPLTFTQLLSCPMQANASLLSWV